MTNITKPSDLSKVWAAGGDVSIPDDAKITTGWEVEIPTNQKFNWLDNRQDQAIAHINQHGVAIWDSATEYQANTSYTQGSDGNIYACKVTNTNQDPVADTTETYWVVCVNKSGSNAKTEQTPTLVNSWSNTSLRYRLFNGALQIYGTIASGTRTDATTVFTLPVGYRPSVARRILIGNIVSLSQTAYGLIGTDGTVKIYNAGASGDLFFDSLVAL
jgi:hypothetical protein